MSLEEQGETTLIPDGGSFRDRNNRVYDDGSRIIRGVSEDAEANFRQFSSQPLFDALVKSGKIVGTKILSEVPTALSRSDQPWTAYLEHEQIPFISYPYEWSFGMLKDAALLTLELAEKSIESGWTMKDATAYNIQWIGSRPIFIDLPSFEPYEEGSPWVGYRQFCMMFLYPLMLKAYLKVDFQNLLRSNLEGIDPIVASSLLSGITRLRKGVLSHVYLHAKMQTRFSNADLDEAKSLTEDNKGEVIKNNRRRHSKAMVLGTIQGLGRVIQSLKTDDTRTTWGNYDKEHSYSDASFAIKQAFVEKAVDARPRKFVWDLGCNTGTFSRICAKHSEYVVAADGDTKAVDRLYHDLKSNGEENILPLVMNLGNISPNQGWDRRERKAFDKRSSPDMILCLALIHHIVISANIPLSEFIQWLRKFNAEIVIEFVSIDDDMVKMLLRNRVNQYGDLTKDRFEEIVSKTFTIADSQSLKGTDRQLYHLLPR